MEIPEHLRRKAEEARLKAEDAFEARKTRQDWGDDKVPSNLIEDVRRLAAYAMAVTQDPDFAETAKKVRDSLPPKTDPDAEIIAIMAEAIEHVIAPDTGQAWPINSARSALRALRAAGYQIGEDATKQPTSDVTDALTDLLGPVWDEAREAMKNLLKTGFGDASRK